MNDDERKLLIKTAQALGSLTELIVIGEPCRAQAAEQLLGRINNSIRPLVLKLARPEDLPPQSPFELSRTVTLFSQPPVPGPASGQFINFDPFPPKDE